MSRLSLGYAIHQLGLARARVRPRWLRHAHSLTRARPHRTWQITSNLKNTITGMKAIMGKKFHSDDIQLEMDLVGYRMVDVAGKVGLPVNYCDEEVMLTPERAMAMLMKCMQGIAELDQGSPVTDVVVSVRTHANCVFSRDSARSRRAASSFRPGLTSFDHALACALAGALIFH